MAITVQTDSLYPSRIQLLLGAFVGPLTSSVLGAFLPERDLQVYGDGKLLTVVSSSFDEPNNRYLIYLSLPLDLEGTIQVTYHMPVSQFKDTSNAIVGGFCAVANYVNDGSSESSISTDVTWLAYIEALEASWLSSHES